MAMGIEWDKSYVGEREVFSPEILRITTSIGCRRYGADGNILTKAIRIRHRA
jgi:hypothetical protein